MSNDYWGRPAEDPGQDAASSDENGQASPETAGQANQEQTGSAAPTYGSPAYEQTAGEQPSSEPAAPSAYGQPDTPSTPPTQAGIQLTVTVEIVSSLRAVDRDCILL